MIKVRIFDKEFGHAPDSYTLGQVPKHIRWVRYGGGDILTAFFTNRCLAEATTWRGPRIAWITEPPSLQLEAYDEIKRLENSFDYILTYDQELLVRNPNKYLFCPLGGSWIPEDVDLSKPKSKMVSMIASEKRGCTGYELRHQIAEALGHRMELFGQIVSRPIECKTEGLLDFRFSVVVENDFRNDYFTEKLIDCLACGTIPFYWGCPRVGNYFVEEGIVPFHSIRDLENKLNEFANAEFYTSHLVSVLNNIERAKKYRCMEDFVFERYPWLFT